MIWNGTLLLAIEKDSILQENIKYQINEDTLEKNNKNKEGSLFDFYEKDENDQ